jgi:hypothetical protein
MLQVPLYHKGFHDAVGASLPTIATALNQLQGFMGANAPARIWVTGHSLGGAMAMNFAARAALRDDGDTGFPNDAVTNNAVKKWGWSNVKLVTYGAPAAANLKLGKKLDTALQAGTGLLTSNRPDIALDTKLSKQLHALNKPAHMRVLHELDPITISKAAGVGSSVHCGTTVQVSRGLVNAIKLIGSPEYHEPWIIRENIVKRLGDAQVTGPVKNYKSMVRTPVDPPNFVELQKVISFHRLSEAEKKKLAKIWTRSPPGSG